MMDAPGFIVGTFPAAGSPRCRDVEGGNGDSGGGGSGDERECGAEDDADGNGGSGAVLMGRLRVKTVVMI